MDLSYDLFYNAASKALGKSGPFTPEELNSKRQDIISSISQSNHPVDIKNKALTYFFKAASIRQKIKKFLGKSQSVSQPGTKDKAMFEREKLAATYFQKINNLFGPAIYKLSTTNNQVEKKNIIDGLKLNINVEFKNYLSKTSPNTSPSSEAGYAFNSMKQNFQQRIDDLEEKYLGVKKEKSESNNEQAQSGLVNIPNLINLSTQDADVVAIQNGLSLNIKQMSSKKPINTVVKQDPIAGTSKSRGSTITVFVSKGQ